MSENDDRFYYVLSGNDHWRRITHYFWLIGGFLAFLGFVSLPLFEFDQAGDWWYNGGQRLADGVSWTTLLTILYLLLGVLIALHGLNLIAIPLLLPGILTLVIVLSTVVAVGLATAGALDEVRNLNRAVWSLGLAGMIIGLALMMWGTIYGLVCQTISSYDIFKREY
jgi:hypothetical protein